MARKKEEGEEEKRSKKKKYYVGESELVDRKGEIERKDRMRRVGTAEGLGHQIEFKYLDKSNYF
jgi:hypothetical protein